jgi:hypothetical protein
MATTISFNANSAHSLVLNITGTGGASKTRDQALNACHDGPLKALLTRTANWTVFMSGGTSCDKIAVREIVNHTAGLGVSSSLQFRWDATGITADGVASGMTQIEIRLPHSSRA